MTNERLHRVLDALPAELPSGRRFIIGIAGPPAGGKSTVAAELAAAIGPQAALLGMDGFHLDDAVLIEQGRRDHKGAPDTFDADGYVRMIATLRNTPNQSIAIPVFDRSLELSRAAGAVILPEHHIVVTEGNYLLLTEEPWRQLAPLLDLTISISPPIETIEARILDRWRTHGFSDEVARHRLTTNDLPNARYVIDNSRPAAIELGGS